MKEKWNEPSIESWDSSENRLLDEPIPDWSESQIHPNQKPADQDRPIHTVIKHEFNFTGSASEYFRIWIVNLFLSIVTLGIYSAWAKVRNKKYFYGSTWLDGSSFEYTANPVGILKGRIIAAVLFGTYSLLTRFVPISTLPMMLALAFVFPWLVVKSLAFNARYTRHRNLSFGFEGQYGDALTIYSGFAFLSIISFGLFIPAAIQSQKNFIVSNLKYGQALFNFKARAKSFYGIYFAALGLLLLYVVVAVLTLAATGLAKGQPGVAPPRSEMFLIYLVVTCGYLIAGAYLIAKQTNLIINNTSLEGLTFKSELSWTKYLWILVTNMLAIVCSVGLLSAWAKVRMYRYRLSCMHMIANRNLDSFAADLRGDVSALGQEIGDAFDFDIGI